MNCVAITRGGTGSMWRFKDLNSADEHALIQYGDALLCSPADLERNFRRVELGRLFARVGVPDMVERVEKAGMDSFHELTARLWERLLETASPPPSDGDAILKLVSDDRRATRRTGVIHRAHPTEGTTAMTENKENGAEATTRPVARAKKFEDTSVISFGVDKEGKQYGPQEDGTIHNAKRAGSAAATRFEFYRAGQTVAEAIAAGATRADINWDVKQGFLILA